jgi:hypothetical protein
MLKRPRESNKTPPEPTTFHQLALAGIDLESGGRFAADVHVVGSTPAPHYPASGVPNDDVGEEAPTGEDINAQIPVGEVFEIDASIERLERLERKERE